MTTWHLTDPVWPLTPGKMFHVVAPLDGARSQTLHPLKETCRLDVLTHYLHTVTTITPQHEHAKGSSELTCDDERIDEQFMLTNDQWEWKWWKWRRSSKLNGGFRGIISCTLSRSLMLQRNDVLIGLDAWNANLKGYEWVPRTKLSDSKLLLLVSF